MATKKARLTPSWLRFVIDNTSPDLGVSPGKLISQEGFRRDLPVGGSLDAEKVFRRDPLASAPLGDAALSNSKVIGELSLPAPYLDSSLNSAHWVDNSGAHTPKQERRYWENHRRRISVPTMERDSKRSKPTAADLAAAERLRKIRDRIPRREQPTQEEIAGKLDSTQGMVSHYLNGRAALNYRAVLVFAEVYNCRPEDIRDDLPEMKAEREYAKAKTELDPSEVDVIWNAYSQEQKAKILRIARAADIEVQKPATLHETRPEYRTGKRGAR